MECKQLPFSGRPNFSVRCLAAVLCLAGAVPAFAGAVNLIQNSTFTSLTNGYGEYVVQSNGTDLTTGTNITSASFWKVDYNAAQAASAGANSFPFLFLTSPTAIDTPGQGFPDAWDNGPRYIWGPNNGSANGYTNSAPGGGNILVMDADYHPQAIYQTVAGMVSGTHYQLAVNWAAAQWSANTGATTEKLSLSVGDQIFNTITYNLPSEGFSGWMTTTWDFVWDGKSNILSMLASGGPSGLPPIVLVDSVSMVVATPEPSSWVALLIGVTGIVGIATVRHRRRARATA